MEAVTGMMPPLAKNTRNHQELEKARKDYPLEPLERE
jgi:hypothetical protein